MKNLDSELLTWWLFLASASLFVIAGVRSGDVFSLGGALLFFGACLIHLIGRRLS